MAIKKTMDGMEIIKRRFGVDPRTDPAVQAFADDFRIAQMIYDARNAAGMSHEQLADAVGTTADVISQLEDADYEGQSLALLRRVAERLDLKLHVELVAG